MENSVDADMEVPNVDLEHETLRARLAANPGPAKIWVAGALALLVVEFGAVAHFAAEILHVLAKSIPGKPGAALLMDAILATADIPTLLSRDLIPNQGYWNGSRYVGTFLGLPPAYAWAIRVVVVYVYAFLWLVWLWKGFTTFRTHYRAADWTPTDDRIDRLRNHSWGLFGFVTVFMFLVMAIFAPTLATTTIDQNINEPYSYRTKYWDGDAGKVKSITIGSANRQSQSQGNPQSNIGPMSYDDFGRFHPFGTATTGKDLFTIIVYGSRITLFVGLLAISLGAGIAGFLALATAYYKGVFDLATIVASDTTQALPSIMLLIAASVVFANTWIAGIYNGALLIAILFAIIYWPVLWRSVRGPSLQVAEEEWVDAARSFGQRPVVIMRKHMLPYIAGYLMVYASLSLAGVMIGTAALSFLGLGINPPTPSWGRAVSSGEVYVASVSWHIATIPGILITIVATGFNALGDGIRDAIDPESGGGAGEAAAGGGGA